MLDHTPSSPSSSLELSRRLGCVIIPLHWQSRVTPHPVTQRGLQSRGPGPRPRAACPFHAGCFVLLAGKLLPSPVQNIFKIVCTSLLTFTSEAWLRTICSKQPSPTPTRISAVGSGSSAGVRAQPCSPTSQRLNPSHGLRALMGFFIVHSLLPGPQCWCL